MTKQLLIIDNDDQSEAIDKIQQLVKNKPFTINCLQFNVGLPNGNDVVDDTGRIDMHRVREKYEREYGARTFHLIAFDYKLNDHEGGVDGVTLIQQFNSIGKTKKAKKLLYSSELTEIVEEYLNDYKQTSKYERAWGKFKTLINLEILDFCVRDDYEKRVVGFIEKITETESDFILEELTSNKDLVFNPSMDIVQGLTFEQIAEMITNGDPQSMKFRKKLIELAVAYLSYIKNE